MGFFFFFCLHVTTLSHTHWKFESSSHKINHRSLKPIGNQRTTASEERVSPPAVLYYGGGVMNEVLLAINFCKQKIFFLSYGGVCC